MAGFGATVRAIWRDPRRRFHWINAILVVCMVLSGFLFMFRKSFALGSPDAKMALMTVHVCIGYAFATNLLVRIVWGLVRDRAARWYGVLPNRAMVRAAVAYLRERLQRPIRRRRDRSALGRLAVPAVFLILMTQAASGLVLAGTQLYFPPFGPVFARMAARDGVDPATITWRNRQTTVDSRKAYYVIKAQRTSAPTHLYGAYLLLLLIGLHVFGLSRLTFDFFARPGEPAGRRQTDPRQT